MIITTQARYYKYNRKPEIGYQHHLISPCDKHDPGIVKIRNEYWIGEKLYFYKRSDIKKIKDGTFQQPFFSYAAYKISMYCLPGKNADQGDFKGDFWLYYWYNLYTYKVNT